MKDQHDLQTQKFDPECRLLHLSNEGVPIPQEVPDGDMQGLVNGLKAGQCELYFSRYWTHGDVRKLRVNYLESVGIEEVLKYLAKVYYLMAKRRDEDIHWIERINLFHFYGLLRILGTSRIDVASHIIAGQIQGSKARRRTLVDVSAYNAKAVLDGKDPRDITEVLTLFEENPYLARDFGNYQIYYHGNILTCIDELADDLRSTRKVPVPHSVLALRFVAELRGEASAGLVERIMDRLYSPLPRDVKNRLDITSPVKVMIHRFNLIV
jgi:hypothetical protein